MYTAGSIGRLRGDSLKFNVQATDEGLFFVDEDGGETAVTTYLDTGNRIVSFLIPPTLKGVQTLVVRTRYNRAESKQIEANLTTPLRPSA